MCFTLMELSSRPPDTQRGSDPDIKGSQTSFYLSTVFSTANLEGSKAKITKVPAGTASPVHQLRRMALRDIKNDLSLNSGLHVTGITRKRQIIDSECKVSPIPSKRTSLQLEDPNSNEKDTENACMDGFLTVLNDHGSHNPEGIKQKEQNIGSPIETTVSRNVMQLSPECRSFSDLSFFAEPSLNSRNEEDESPLPSSCVNKYFSTPMPPTGKQRKKLSPIIEVESEAALRTIDQKIDGSPAHSPLYRSFFANECQDIVKQIEGSESDSRRSPVKRKVEELEVSCIDAEPPPYECTPMKSMLAGEIANISSLENSLVKDGSLLFGVSLLDLEKTGMQFPEFDASGCGDKSSKRLSLNDCSVKGFYVEDKLDLSSTKRNAFESQSCDLNKGFDFETEHSTAASYGLHSPSSKSMKSVSNGANAHDAFQVPVGTMKSEQTHLNEKDLTQCASKNRGENLPVGRKEQSINSTLEGTFLSNPTPAQKLKELLPQTLGNVTHDMDHVNKGLSIANATIDVLSQTSTDLQKKTVDELSIIAANTTWMVDEMSELHSVGPANNFQIKGAMARTVNITQDLTHEYLSEANQTRDVVPSASVTQEILLPHDEVCAVNTTQIIEEVPHFVNTTQDIASSNEVCAVNTTRVIGVQLSMDTTQDIVSSNEVCAVNTTQVIGVQLSKDTTQDIVSEVCATNTTQILEVPQCVNTTQDFGSAIEVCAVNTTQVIEVPQCVNTTLDIASVNEVCAVNSTQVIEAIPQCVDTTQDIASVHEVCAVNMTQVIEAIPQCVDTTQDIAPVNEVCAGNTTQVIEVAQCVDSAQDIGSANELCAVNMTLVVGVPRGEDTTQDITVKEVYAVSTTPVLKVPRCVDTVSANEVCAVNKTPVMGVLPQSTDATQDIALLNADDADSTPHVTVVLQSTANACEMASSRKVNVIKLASEDKTQENVLVHAGQGSAPVCNAAVEFGDSDVITINAGNALLEASVRDDHVGSGIPEHVNPHGISSGANAGIANGSEAMKVNMATEPSVKSVTEHGEISAKDFHNASCHSSTPVELVNADVQASDEDKLIAGYSSADGNPDVTQKEALRTDGNDCNACANGGSSHSEVCPSAEPKAHFLMSESYSTIPEEDVQDVSVFSVGSLSFVTSTPVPGMTNFAYQKACKDPEPQAHNKSGYLGEPQRKISLDQSVTALLEQDVTLSGSKNQKKTKTLPTTIKRTMLPPQSSAQRSIALLQNPPVRAAMKETTQSKLPSSGIAGRGIRPPMAQHGLPRASLGNLKQSVDGPAGNKLLNRLRTPKTTTEKAKCSTSQPLQTPLGKPPSQLGTLKTARLPMGAPPAMNRLPEPVNAGESSGSRTGIMRPGRLSLRPPLPSSIQKTSPKSSAIKSFLPGPKRGTNTLNSNRDLSAMKEGMAARKSLRPNTSTSNKALLKAAGKSNCSSSQLQQGTEAEMREAEDCNHLETCKCCHTRIQQLIEQIQDLKKQYGQV